MNASQLELTLDKLQLIATSAVLPHHKLRWLKWWNSSVHTREAVRFPVRPVNDERLNSFIVKAAWWAGVSLSIKFFFLLSYYVILLFKTHHLIVCRLRIALWNCLKQLSTKTMFL